MSESAGNKSLRWMIASLMAAILAMGWGFAAAEYGRGAGGYPAGRSGLGTFFLNAGIQLSNADKVIIHVVTESRWVLYVFGGLELVAAAFGIYAWRLAGQLAEMDNKYAKKRSKR